MHKLHFHPERHWLNDPNGLCQSDGWYHMFFQHNPLANVWGNIHWGHARSRDLYAWEEMPVALSPATELGEVHCFSGSCCKDRDGKPHFFYTSIGREEDGRGVTDGAQQWTASASDPGMVTLTQSCEHALRQDMHRGLTVRDWRDPCVVFDGKRYLMVTGGCVDGRGSILLYTSTDLVNWNFKRILAQSDTADGVPWECPNLALLGGTAVLIYSPCATVRYKVGRLDSRLHFIQSHEDVLDAGADRSFYAPQCFRDDSGRTLMFGWMAESAPDEYIEKQGFNGCMTLPRELTIVDGDLWCLPVDGWQKWVRPAQLLTVRQGQQITVDAGQHFILRMTVEAAACPFIRLMGAPDGTDGAMLLLKNEGERITMRLMNSIALPEGQRAYSPATRSAPVRDGKADIFLCVDGTTVECCVNGHWLSGRIYPRHERATQLTLQCSQSPARRRLKPTEAELYLMK